MVCRNSDSIPNEREEGIGQPIHPAEILDLPFFSKIQIHPNVQEFVRAQPGHIVRSEPVCLEVLVADVEVSLEGCNPPAAGTLGEKSPRISMGNPNLIASHLSVHNHSQVVQWLTVSIITLVYHFVKRNLPGFVYRC
jgi:hypothetical protein